MEAVGTYYKLVASRGGHWRSWDLPNGAHALTYCRGTRTTPQFGGVLAYRTAEEAEHFACQYLDLGSKFAPWAVLRGRGVKIALPAHRISFALSATRNNKYERVWASDTHGLGCVGPWPDGTVALAWFEPEGAPIAWFNLQEGEA